MRVIVFSKGSLWAEHSATSPDALSELVDEYGKDDHGTDEDSLPIGVGAEQDETVAKHFKDHRR
jgi:hypothetical protein